MEILDELAVLVAALDAVGVDYGLCGGLALAVHGLPRATQDIDLLIRPDDVNRCKAVARSCGFDLEAAPMHFASSGMDMVRVSKIEGQEVLSLDLLCANSRLEDIWQSRVRVPWATGALWVVSKEALIALKLTAGRPQDLADIARLRGSR